MSKSTRRLGRAGIAAAATAALVASGLTAFAGAASASEPVDFERIAGSNRYATSVEATQAFGTSEEVILASGENGHYVDALSANFLAGVVEVPILLTKEDKLPGVVKQQLEDGDYSTVHIIGGDGAVSEAVEAEVRSTGADINRLAGSNRYRTNVEVIEAGDEENADTALIATGVNFPDALGAGPVAYAGKHPIGLTKTEDIPDFVVDALKATGVDKAVIVGGEAAVGPEVAAELEAKGIDVVTRLSGGEGGNRETTSIAVREFALENLGFSESEVDFASGRAASEGVDALSGGPVSGKEDVAILITSSENRANRLLEYLEENCQSIDEGDIYGGDAAITVALEEALEEAAQCETNQAFGVTPPTNESETAPAGATNDETVTFSGIDAEQVNLALVECNDVTVAEDGTVTFQDTSGAPNQADLDDSAAVSIQTINGVSSAYADNVNDVDVADNGSVTVELNRDADGCARLVAYVDANNNNQLDLDENNAPTEPFAVSGQILVTDPNAVNASPETKTNPYGSSHTVTAQLVADQANADETDDVAVAQAGAAVRFSRYAVADLDACDEGGNTQPAGTPVEVVNATTDENGKATYSFTASDPNASTTGQSTYFCVFVQADTNEDGTLDDADTVSKTFTDAAAVATTVDATPESETNVFGDQHTITATVTDQFGNPVAGDEVTFVVDTNSDGPATANLSATRTTDANGVATFTYRGPADPSATAFNASVTDKITVSVDNPTGTDPAPDEVEKTWAEGVASVDGQSYDTIAEALANAEAGDTITTTGDFQENVTVDKAVTIDGGGNSRLIGQFDVISDDVTIRGFRIESETVGIEVFTGGYTGLTFSNNTITGPVADALDTGIFFNAASAGTVSGNTIIDAVAGVATDTDGTVTISSNTFQNNEEGVGVGGVNVGITGNTFTTNDATDIYVNAYVPVSDAYLNQIAANNTFNPAAEVDYANDEVEPVGP